MANGRSGMALRQIRRLFDEGTLTGLTDAQLLDRFVAVRDEGAFTILVERHGPMVLAVCRGVLKDINDAEDAFQATFLVLFRKAGGLRVGGSLGSWLYRVAYRIAIRANAVATRCRERSGEEGAMADQAAPAEVAEIDRELLPVIHQEIDRLPEKYRAPVALCCLEDLSYEEACATARVAAGHRRQPAGTGEGLVAFAIGPARDHGDVRGPGRAPVARGDGGAGRLGGGDDPCRVGDGCGGERGDDGRGGLGGGCPQRSSLAEDARDQAHPDDGRADRRRDGRSPGMDRDRRGPKAEGAGRSCRRGGADSIPADGTSQAEGRQGPIRQGLDPGSRDRPGRQAGSQRVHLPQAEWRRLED